METHAAENRCDKDASVMSGNELDRCPIAMSGNEANQLFNMLKEKLDEVKISIEKSIDEIKSCIDRDRERRSLENEQLHSRISECNNRITALETGKISVLDSKVAVLSQLESKVAVLCELSSKVAVLSDQAGAGVALRGHLIWLVFAIVASVVSGFIGAAIKNI